MSYDSVQINRVKKPRDPKNPKDQKFILFTCDSETTISSRRAQFNRSLGFKVCWITKTLTCSLETNIYMHVLRLIDEMHADLAR